MTGVGILWDRPPADSETESGSGHTVRSFREVLQRKYRVRPYFRSVLMGVEERAIQGYGMPRPRQSDRDPEKHGRLRRSVGYKLCQHQGAGIRLHFARFGHLNSKL